MIFWTVLVFFFFKQKTAYEMRISDWSSDVCSSDLFLPPYDTRTTIERLERLVRRFGPDTVLALGDSFHDRRARSRLGAAEAERLRHLTGSADWVWIAGNHDPEPPADLGGRIAGETTVGALTFRHAPAAEAGAGEICEIGRAHV